MIKFLRIGKIVKPQGIKGEVKVLTTTTDNERFNTLKKVYLHEKEEATDKDFDGVKNTKEVSNVKYLKDFVILKLVGIDTVEAAENLRNMSLYVDRDDSYKLNKNEFFVADLNGLKVYDYDTNEEIGIVKDILSTKTQNILVVDKLKEESLIPLIDEFIKEVDLDNNIIKVKLIEGM